jgi:hypothetical protein
MDKFFPGKFVPLPSEMQGYGQLKSQTGQCVDTYGHQHMGERLGMYSCHPRGTPSQNQAFLFAKNGQIRIIWDLCFDAQGGHVVLYACSSEVVWTHDHQQRLVHHRGQCLEAKGADLVTAECSDAPGQKWSFSGFLNG